MSAGGKRFYGKYRGKVSDNDDPLMLGRIKAKVPSLLTDQETGWATPCSPYAGNGVGFFFIPPTDANVWIEFEEGRLDHPIWTGGFWAEGELPKAPAIPDVKVIKTDFATITIDDLLQSVTIETTSQLQMSMDTTGIKLSNGSSTVELTPASVSINDGALEVV